MSLNIKQKYGQELWNMWFNKLNRNPKSLVKSFYNNLTQQNPCARGCLEVGYMAHEEHTKIVRLGVDYWNKWRNNDPTILPYLSGADLAESSFIRWFFVTLRKGRESWKTK